jgi:hypothetical protein
MRKLVLLAVLLAATNALADGLGGRALVGYEQRTSNASSTSGVRQTYDLHLDRALTGTSSFRIFVRADDFDGSVTRKSLTQSNRTREIRPGAELLISAANIEAIVRSEWFDTRSEVGNGGRANRTLERSTAALTWTPLGLPTFRVLGQHNRTNDDASTTRLTEDMETASVAYGWRGLGATAEARRSRSFDPLAGYDRTGTFRNVGLSYGASRFGGKLTFGADASLQAMHTDQSAVGRGTTSVPIPVVVSRALFAIDDTPLDSRDHPAAPIPTLIDADRDTSAGISLGPDAVSFQNFVVDLGVIDRLDEFRVVVRDAARNPLRNGGGPVTFDVYTSADGELWTAVASRTAFNAPLSLYSVTFDVTFARWFKVVSFGVNGDPTFVTELQVFYHSTIDSGQQRTQDQRNTSVGASFTLHPVERFVASYSGLYSSIRQENSGQPLFSTRDLEHNLTLQYDVTRAAALRARLLQRDVRNFAGRANDGAKGFTLFADYKPTRQLLVTGEVGRQDETLDGSSFTVDTRAVHATTYVIRSVYLTLDAGVQTQTFSDDTTAHRTFANLSGNIQLAPNLRLLLQGTMQQTRSESSDPAVQLLGAARDNRLSGDFVWRPGRQLSLSTRFGWVSGQALTAFTQRYHVDWYPFADGTVSLGGSYDEDIDPQLNRRARRAIVTPRWMMNRFATLDINYTMVGTQADSGSNRQRSVFATLTLTR